MRTFVGSLLLDLRNRGAELRFRADRLVVEAPGGVLTNEDREALVAAKHLVLKRLVAESRLMEMSLAEFEREGLAIEISVPWLDETLWWVPRIEHIADLVQHNVARGRVYTAKELTNLTSLLESGATARDLKGIGKLKAALGAEIVSVEADTGSDGAA